MRGQGRTFSRKGFLLLIVVVMIAVAALMLTSTASTGMRVAATALQEERKMRDRWAVTSLQRYLMSAAPKLLSRTQVDSPDHVEPEWSVWRDVTLADKRWRVIVSDESAKMNLLLTSRQLGHEAAEEAIERLISGRGSLAATGNAASEHSSRRWDAWLEGRRTDAPHSARQLAMATQNVTLWGDGRVNVTRADRSTIDVAWRQLFGRAAPEAMHHLRGERPPPSSERLISGLGLRETQAKKASRWFSTTSSCFSVWVFCETDRRPSATLLVQWGADDVTGERREYEY